MKRLALILILLAVIPIALLFYVTPWTTDAPAIPSGDQAASTDRRDLPSEGLTIRSETEPGKAPSEADSEAQARRQALDVAHIRVSGQLVDAHGAPMERVGLNLHYGDGGGPGFFNIFHRSASQKQKPDAATRTDAGGRFSFEIPADKGGRIRLVSEELVWSKHIPHFMPSEKDLDLGQLTVHPGAVLLGRVLTENDLPIGDAKVVLMAYETQFVSRQAKTNAQGQFELRGLPGGQVHLTVSSSGYMTRNLQALAEIGKTKDDLVIRLRAGHDLFGIVLDERSKPVVGASVEVTGTSMSSESGSSQVSTDKNGEFHAQGLGSDPFSLRATANGYATTNLDKLPESAAPVRVEMTRLGKIAGRLVDETAMPIQGSRIRASNKPPQEDPAPLGQGIVISMGFDGSRVVSSSGSSKTDKDGKFIVANIHAGQVWLIAEGTHRQAVHGPLMIKPGEEISGVEMRAERGARVVVTVIDPDGEPIEKVGVRLSKVKSATDSNPGSIDASNLMLMLGVQFQSAPKGGAFGRTDKDGKCELGGVEPGKYEIHATHGSWITPEPVAMVMPAKGVVEATVQMLAGGTVALLVLDHLGKPAAGQRYRITAKAAAAGAITSGSFSFSMPIVVSGGLRSGSRGKQGHTDATGRANIGPLAPGDYVALLELGSDDGPLMLSFGSLVLPGQGDKQIGEPVPFRIVPGQTVDVTLIRPAMANLSGTVLDDAGAVHNASVSLTPGGSNPSAYGGTRQTRTDGDGVYRFSGLKPGTYELAIKAPGGGLAHGAKVELPGSGEHRQNMFLRQGSVEVQLRKDGKAIEGVKVMLAPVGKRHGGSEVKASDSEGLVRFENVPTGRYTLRYEDSRYLRPDREVFEVESGSTAKRELSVKPAAMLQYECKPAPGTERVQWFTIEYSREGDKPRTEQRQGLEGKVSGLEPGRYAFRARRGAGPNGNWTTEQIIQLKGGEPARLEFILP